MSVSLLSNQAMESLMSKFPGLDESQLKEIAGAVFEAVPQQKTQRKVKEIPAEERCMARMWPKETYDEEGNYIYGKPGQCCRRKKGGDYCAQHQKQADVTTTPLQFTNDGPKGKFKRHGLFHGRVDEELPFHDDQGHLVIFWNTPEVHDWVQTQKEAGTYKEHPAWRDLWLGEREGGSSKKKKATKKDQLTAEKKKTKDLKFKKKRGLSPYFAFLAEKRAEIKATLEAQADEGAKISVADVTKAAGAQWKALKEAIDAAEKRIAAGDDLTDEERDTYKDQNEEMAKYVAASDASKKEAAEYNDAKAKEITASHELQLENAKADTPKDAAPKVSLKLSAKPATTKASPAKMTSEVVVEQKPELEEGEVAEEELEEETKEQPNEEDVFGPDSDDEDGVEAELEEFTHEGQTLFKMADEENEGCFLILNRSPGGEEDEYEQWGTMDADGNISKDDE
tara:strand:- start:116 stop:1474 length:1359 start_codon:yes stop_codon:yes gene_type:complete